MVPSRILFIWPNKSLQEGISILSSHIISWVPDCFDIHQWLWITQLKDTPVELPLCLQAVWWTVTQCWRKQKNINPLQQILIASGMFYETELMWLHYNLKPSSLLFTAASLCFGNHGLLQSHTHLCDLGSGQVTIPKGTQTAISYSASPMSSLELSTASILLYQKRFSPW